jgi:hypothetical protein
MRPVWRAARFRVVVSALVLLGGAGAFLASPAAPAATAGEQADAAITWSVRPADETGRDGRSWVELTLDPGETATERLAISNLGEVPATFRISAADGYLTDTGRFNMLPSSVPSSAAGTWISVQEHIDLAPGETQIVPFEISVPADASPGDHPAGIAASIVSTGDGGDGNQVSIESRVGFRVMTRVSGEVRVGVDATEVDLSYRYSWNPFQPGSLTLRVRAVNSGNVQVALTEEYRGPGRADLRGSSAEPNSETDLFPGDERTIVHQIDGVWPIGLVQGELVLSPSADGAEAAAPPAVPVAFSTWVLPWPQLALLAGIASIAFALVVGRRRREAHVQRLVADAREAGRRDQLHRGAPSDTGISDA